MPKVKNPLFSQEARGGIGGLVYNTWRGINYVKTNTSPTGQGSAKRLAAQALLSLVAKLWRGITAGERLAWSAYATAHPVDSWTGPPIRLTGMNWFSKCNALLRLVGQSGVTAAPTIAAPDAPTELTLTYASQSVQASWATTSYASQSLMFSATKPQSAGITGKREQAAFAAYATRDATQPVTILTAPAAGTITAFVKSVDWTTGLPSTEVSATVVSTGV